VCVWVGVGGCVCGGVCVGGGGTINWSSTRLFLLRSVNNIIVICLSGLTV